MMTHPHLICVSCFLFAHKIIHSIRMVMYERESRRFFGGKFDCRCECEDDDDDVRSVINKLMQFFLFLRPANFKLLAMK